MKAKLEISGIKCDSCDYKDSSVQMSDYHNWLNKHCPICGTNLLTESDYEMINKLSLLVASQNCNMAISTGRCFAAYDASEWRRRSCSSIV